MGEFNLETVNKKLDKIDADVIALEGITSQYAKSGTPISEVGTPCSWAMELNTDFAPPETTEIEPGIYNIWRIRAGVADWQAVTDAAASESVGTIYASYTPTEFDWNVGDLMKVIFSGGFIRTDEEPTKLLTDDANIGDTIITMLNTDNFLVGMLVRIYEPATPANSEWRTITFKTGNQLTLDVALVNDHLMINSATVTRAVRYDLTTAVFFTMLQSEAQSYKIIATGFFDAAGTITTGIDSTRPEGDGYWNGSWLMPISNTYGAAVNQPRLIVYFEQPGGIFHIDGDQAFTSAPGDGDEYVVLGNNSQLVPAADSTNNQTPAHVVGNKEDIVNIASSASLVALLRDIIAGLSVVDAGAGGGFEIDGYPTLVDALGTTGDVITDSATSVLGATGANNADNAFLSDLVVADDDGSVLERLEWLQSMAVIAKGTFTNSSATVPADSARTEIDDDYFAGSWLMPITFGAPAYLQPRLIVSYTATGGIFTLDPEHYFTIAPNVTNEYVVLSPNDSLVPAPDTDSNYTPAHVIGNKGDGATDDDMSDLAVASLVAEMKRALIRMSPDAFTADIQGGAETALDAMLGALATYFSALGAAWAVQMNNYSVKDNLEETIEDLTAVIGIDGTNTFTDISGSANGTINDIIQKFATIIGADGANTFAPYIYGANQSTVETAFEALATYLSPAGAAWDVQMDNRAAKTNLEETVEDLTAVIGIDGTNQFTDLSGSANYTIDAITQKFGVVIGIDGANTFAPDIGGVVGTIEAAFDAIGDVIVTGYDSSAITANEDGSVLERLEQIQGATNVGAGTTLPADTSIYDIAGSNYDAGAGVFNTDSIGDDLNTLGQYIMDGTPGGESGSTLPAGKSLVNIIGTNYVDAGGGFNTENIGDDLNTIYIETETQTLAQAAGTRNSNDRAGLLIRWTADEVAAISASIGVGTLAVTESTGGTNNTISDVAITTATWVGGLAVSTSNDNIYAARPIVASVAGSVIVYPPFDNSVDASDTFLLVSSWRPNVWDQQAAVVIDEDATNAGETFVLDLSVAGFSYMVNNLRFKSDDPGANTVTVRLYELINGGAVLVDSFDITGGGAGVGNWETYHSLMDMFGVANISGDDIGVTIEVSAGANVACTGQYQYALARTS